MSILHIDLKNFGSYQDLSLNLMDNGLTLIHGATGSGKSTLCDAIPWCLFGRTSKGGAVDEVLTWPGDKPARGTVRCLGFDITRIRGNKAKDNDLYITKGGKQIRGKDLIDTQKLINNFLGYDYDLYVSSAYCHEFSKTAGFFLASAKTRKEICEQLVDLSLAKKLQTRVSEERKELSSQIQTVTTALTRAEAALSFETTHYEKTFKLNQAWLKIQDTLQEHINTEIQKAKAVKTIAEAKVAAAERSLKDVKTIQTQIAALGPEVCGECGASKHSGRHQELLQELSDTKQNAVLYQSLVQQLKAAEDNLARVSKPQSQDNPYTSTLNQLDTSMLVSAKAKITLEAELSEHRTALDDLEALTDILEDFRGMRVTNTITGLQDKTNQALAKHFDSELRIELTPDGDRLEVEIVKDGNSCTYSQLSKGQRQLLRLAFGTSVMETVANHHGIQVNQVFFDEALDGLDESMKRRAFNLLNEFSQSYNSTFVVEHSSEIKTMFTNQIHVTLTDKGSILEKV